MPVRIPYTAGPDGPVLELEPDATDSDVVQTIATLVEIHLNGATPEEVAEFWLHSMLPIVAGLMVATVGEEAACDAFAGMPKWVREANLLETLQPAGPGH